MNNICKMCNKPLRYYDKVRLEHKNSEYLCLNCYSEVTNNYKKGVITPEETTAYKEFNQEYDNIIQEYKKTIQKYAIQYNKTIQEMLKDFLHLENELSIEIFKKVRSCLSKNEHIIIINNILTYDINKLYNIIDDKTMSNIRISINSKDTNHNYNNISHLYKSII